MKPANRDASEQKNRVSRRIETLKSLVGNQAKITEFITTPVKADKMVNSFGEEVNPKYYEMVQFYFDRIPALKPYKPLDVNKYRKDQVKFFRMQVEQAQLVSDLKEWTFLPYSDHRNLGMMPMDMRLTLDTVNPGNARATELRVKKAFITSKVKEMIAEFAARRPIYENELEKFIASNSTSIIQLRTQLMLESKPEVLEIIIDYMQKLHSSGQKIGKYNHIDYLPFAEIVPTIVESMERHPVKPKLSFIGLPKE